MKAPITMLIGNTDAAAHTLQPLPTPAMAAAAAAERDRARRERDLETARAEGYAKGARDGAQQAHAKVADALRALAEAARQVQAARQDAIEGAQPEVLQLCLAVARKVVHAELQARPEGIGELIRALLAEAKDKLVLAVRLHPEDLALVRGGEEGALLADLKANVLADPAISRGGCLVETNHGLLDARLEARLAVLAEQLLATEGGA